MNITRWNEKVSALADKLCSENGIVYHNRADGVVFCDKHATWLLFCPKSGIASIHANQAKSCSALSAYWEKALRSDGKLAECSASGRFAKTAGRSYKVHQFKSGDLEVYAQDKYIRMFPKNTMFYISGRRDPIVAGIWENDQLHVIGFVMPLAGANATSENFVAA